MRDENPFVLGVGIPLLPQPAPQAGHIGIDAYIAEGNTQLISSAPGAKVVFAAETRESRISVKYAFNNAWSARVSVGDEWIGVGFLDRPIQHFHNLIGAPRGFRGGRISGVPGDTLRALRDGTQIPDTRLRALAHFTNLMVRTRGNPSREDMQEFVAAGFSETQVLQVLLAIAVKTISNYSNHLFETPVDATFAAYAWKP